MQVIQVISGLSKKDGGPSYTLPQLWSHLMTSGVDVRVYTTASDSDEINTAQAFRIVKTPRVFLRSFAFSPELGRLLFQNLDSVDIYHNHGCWLYPNWAVGAAARHARKPLIISPLGHLDSWSLKHHRYRKWLVKHFIEIKNWKYCSAFVAKSSMEADELKRLGFSQKVRVIPNGIDPAEWNKTGDDCWNSFPHLRNYKLILFLSRIHPKKGLPLLLKVWGKLASQFPDWHLVVAGNMETSYGRAINQWVLKEPFKERISFLGELSGGLKQSTIAAANLFVLPSLSENFGQVILEALASGVPVITTQGCPWSGIKEHECGWWIDANETALQESLTNAMRLPTQELQMMGQRGKEWVSRDFDWKNIAKQMYELYQEVV